MRHMMGVLAALFRRWRYVEEGAPTASVPEVSSEDTESHRTRRAIERGERRLTDYKLNGCDGLARECEASLRSLRTHLAALEFSSNPERNGTPRSPNPPRL